MELKEMIKVMQHYENGGVVEFSEDYFKTILGEADNEDDGGLCWDWDTYDYRIKDEKQKVVISKWLIQDVSSSEYFIIESSDVDLTTIKFTKWKKIKLIESYEVEL